MTRWPKFHFLYGITTLAVIVLIAHYFFGADIRPRRIGISWLVIGIQVLYNLLHFRAYKKQSGQIKTDEEELAI